MDVLVAQQRRTIMLCTPLRRKCGESGACIDEINAARQRAGLSAFTKMSLAGPDGELPADTSQLWKIPCEPLVPAEEQPPTNNELFYKSAYASFSMPSETLNCTEAVDYWNAAFPNFEAYSLPPPNDLSTPLYSNRDNISFVALYSPSNTASADCRRRSVEQNHILVQSHRLCREVQLQQSVRRVGSCFEPIISLVNVWKPTPTEAA
ncbi:SAG family member [Eimeria brunetti]|uniref:SAG family member n=1 Tax=Eimeria brunetti TaxID=51314 RepID=U6L8X3_9EIME|nr:SAG family member [Eimeria brunetti]